MAQVKYCYIIQLLIIPLPALCTPGCKNPVLKALACLICTQHGIRNVFCGQAPSQISAVVNIENPMLTMTMTVRAVTGNNARHDNLTLKTKHQSRATLLKDKVVPPGKRSQTYQ